MSNKNLKKRQKELIIVLILVIICSLIIISFSFTHPGKKIRVSKGGEVIEELPLGQDQSKEYVFDGETNILKIENGKADVISANCQNQICVNTPPIDEVGEVIACLPHELIFEVVE